MIYRLTCLVLPMVEYSAVWPQKVHERIFIELGQLPLMSSFIVAAAIKLLGLVDFADCSYAVEVGRRKPVAVGHDSLLDVV
jgi:hypothetical protein